VIVADDPEQIGRLPEETELIIGSTQEEISIPEIFALFLLAMEVKLSQLPSVT